MSQSTKSKTNPHLLPLQEQWINMSVKEIKHLFTILSPLSCPFYRCYSPLFITMRCQKYFFKYGGAFYVFLPKWCLRCNNILMEEQIYG